MTDFLTWDEVKNQLGSDCTVILGNGFSRSYCNKAFNQSEILQHMPSLQGLTGISDIEKCIEETQAKVNNANNTKNEYNIKENLTEYFKYPTRYSFNSSI